MAGMRTVAAATSLVFTLGLVCFVRLGFAQQPDSAGQRPDSSLSAEALKKLSIEQLMNLQVTSVSKRPERLSQTASAIQVITQEDIRRSGASSLAEALRLAANLQVAQIDSRQWAISARGFNGSTANKLLVLIDGRTVYTPLFSGVFWDVQEVPLQDIDRIEVISGPGATLWGANAVNGVITSSRRTPRTRKGSSYRVAAAPSSTDSARFATERPWARVFARGSTAGGSIATRRPCPADRMPPMTGTWSRVGFGWIGTRRAPAASPFRAICTMAASRKTRAATLASAVATSWRSGRARCPNGRASRPTCTTTGPTAKSQACLERISTPTTSIYNTVRDWARDMTWCGGSGTGTSTIAPSSARTPPWHSCRCTSRESGSPGSSRTRSRSFPTASTSPSAPRSSTTTTPASRSSPAAG